MHCFKSGRTPFCLTWDLVCACSGAGGAKLEMEKQRRAEVEDRLRRSEESAERLRVRCDEIDTDFERFRRANRKLPEATIRAELAKVTGEKAEAEARVDRERAEKNQALLEKERYRAHVHQVCPSFPCTQLYRRFVALTLSCSTVGEGTAARARQGHCIGASGSRATSRRVLGTRRKVCS